MAWPTSSPPRCFDPSGPASRWASRPPPRASARRMWKSLKDVHVWKVEKLFELFKLCFFSFLKKQCSSTPQNETAFHLHHDHQLCLISHDLHAFSFSNLQDASSRHFVSPGLKCFFCWSSALVNPLDWLTMFDWIWFSFLYKWKQIITKLPCL